MKSRPAEARQPHKMSARRLTITPSFTAPPTRWRFLMVSSMWLCQPAERQRVERLENSSRHTESRRDVLWDGGNLPTTGSFLKGILERDRFSISRQTVKTQADEPSASLRSGNAQDQDQTSAGFGTYRLASSALRLNPCKRKSTSAGCQRTKLFLVVTSQENKTFFVFLLVLFSVVELQKKKANK